VSKGQGTFFSSLYFLVKSDLEVVAVGLSFENRLESASNFVPWKVRVTLVLMEDGLWDFANTIMTPPTDPKDLAAHELKDVKAKRIILDVVKDHLILHISEKKSSREMFVALTNLFQSNNTNRKIVLRENLRDTKMTRSDTVTIYLTKITQVCDQQTVVGEVVTDEVLVRMALNGFSKPWAPFIKGIEAREKLPKFDRLWDEFI
jgi:hypothetical protein